MSKRYCCAKCGAELNENEYLVNISPMVFRGMATTDSRVQLPIYITETELKALIERGASNDGVTELTMEELLQYAYNELNQKQLEKDRTNVADALAVFEVKAGLREADETETGKTEEAEAEEYIFGFGTQTGNEGTTTDDKDDFYIPGFTGEMSAQALNNFPGGKGRFTMEESREYGIQFKALSYTGTDNNGVSDGRRCRHCKGKILKGAFEKDQHLVGVVGFQKVGKSCLIAALCHTLLKGEGSPVLAMPEKSWEELYKNELLRFRRGYTLAKTAASGANTYNPSVATRDAIWTFIDVPGEAIKKPDTGDFNIDAVMNRFISILRCDAYIFCTDYGMVKDASEFGEMVTVFGSLLNNLENRNRPVLFALTQEDEKISDDHCIGKLCEEGPMSNCVHSEYLYYKENKFVLNRHPDMKGILDQLAENSYLSVISCSAYGFEPMTLSADDITEEEKPPHPKNVDAIIEWIEQLYGKRAVRARVGKDENAIKMDGHMLRRRQEDGSWEKHEERERCAYISRMFVNPSDLDKVYIDSYGETIWLVKTVQVLSKMGIDPLKQKELLKKLLDILKRKKEVS